MTKAKMIQAARARAVSDAQEILDERTRRLRKRARASSSAVARTAQANSVRPAAKLIKAAGAGGTAGVLVAEGDSWFDYPLHDVLDMLEDEHAFDVESVAHHGDRIEDMAYARGQYEELARRIEKVVRSARIPRAVLLSGGGNDIAGAELAVMLNHINSPAPGWSDEIVRNVIDERIFLSFVGIVTKVTQLCKAITGQIIPIVVHGYDNPVPDGRGFLGGWGKLPGPWLEPAFRSKGYDVRSDNVRYMETLIARFNSMLVRLTQTPGCKHVRYVDLRGTLSNGSDYKTDWANELHPTKSGFRRVAQQIADII